MKKVFLLVLGLLLFLSACGKENKPSSADVAPKPEPIQTVTLSFAGDCTLGTDVAFGGMTLPWEVENQNKDYSWFFKNVLPIFQEDDLTMVNLEGTLTTQGVREAKTFAFRGNSLSW